MNDPKITEEIKSKIHQLEAIKDEIKNDVDIKEEPDDPSLVEFKFIPNNVVLKRTTTLTIHSSSHSTK